MIQCEGQIEMTEYMKSKIKCGYVKDLTSWINSQGKSQYKQIEDVVRKVCKEEKYSQYMVDRITNAVSIYVLEQSMGYMNYLKKV